MRWVAPGQCPEWDVKAWERLQGVVGRCPCGGPEETPREECPVEPWMLMGHEADDRAVFKHRITRALVVLVVALFFILVTAPLRAEELRPIEPGASLDLLAEGRLRYPYPSLKELEAKILNNYDLRIKKLEDEEAKLKSSLLNRLRLSASAGASARERLLATETGGVTAGGLNAGLSLTVSIPLAELLPGKAPSHAEERRRELEFARLVREKVKELRALYNDRELAILATQVVEAEVRVAEVRYEKAKVAYAIQEADQVEVASAQKGLIEARLRFLEAENKIYVLESRIAALLGEPYEFPNGRR